MFCILFICNFFSFATTHPYDFGSFAGSPKSIFVNPALTHFCGTQVYSSLSNRKTNFEIDSPNSVVRRPEQLGGGIGVIQAGGCYDKLGWLTVGSYVDLTPLTFKLRSEDPSNPSILPYRDNQTPTITLGGNVRLIDDLWFGLNFNIQQNVDVLVDQKIVPNPVTDVIIEVRSVNSFGTGFAYQWRDSYFHFSYSEKLTGVVDVDIDIPIEIGVFNFSLDLLFADVALAFNPEKITVGYITQWNGIGIDVGFVEESWSDLEKFFLDLDLPFGAEEFLFLQQSPSFKDTINPYSIVHYPFSDNMILTFGYALRANPIEALTEDSSVVSGDMHVFKFGGKYGLEFYGHDIALGGQFILGIMQDETLSATNKLSGNFTSIIGFLQVFF